MLLLPGLLSSCPPPCQAASAGGLSCQAGRGSPWQRPHTRSRQEFFIRSVMKTAVCVDSFRTRLEAPCDALFVVRPLAGAVEPRVCGGVSGLLGPHGQGRAPLFGESQGEHVLGQERLRGNGPPGEARLYLLCTSALRPASRYSSGQSLLHMRLTAWKVQHGLPHPAGNHCKEDVLPASDKYTSCI
jgi:hypothetical protein